MREQKFRSDLNWQGALKEREREKRSVKEGLRVAPQTVVNSGTVSVFDCISFTHLYLRLVVEISIVLAAVVLQ
jgi:hypothetical protein